MRHFSKIVSMVHRAPQIGGLVLELEDKRLNGISFATGSIATRVFIGHGFMVVDMRDCWTLPPNAEFEEFSRMCDALDEERELLSATSTTSERSVSRL